QVGIVSQCPFDQGVECGRAKQAPPLLRYIAARRETLRTAGWGIGRRCAGRQRLFGIAAHGWRRRVQKIGSYRNAARKQRRRRHRGGESGETPHGQTHTATPYGLWRLGWPLPEPPIKNALI